MRCSAEPTTVDALRPWRDLYRHEMHCQIVHDALHSRPGWTREYALLADGAAAGYGSVAVGGPWTGDPAIFEFYVLPGARRHTFALFAALLAAGDATRIETQSNDPLLTPMLHTFARTVVSESILFDDRVQTSLAAPGAVVRPREAGDAAALIAQELDADADWVLVQDGAVAAAGGILYHYNRPYGDVYMKVAVSYRRRGLGAFLVQELKRLCYGQGSIPACRCRVGNIASRATLQKAGFAPCGHILVGTVTR